ncbi:MAG: FAD binding domain-containing protein [Planctomycetota bacterium]|jgi:4-hydroxybenzoyl-CoA reductase subunit beta
MLRLPPFDYRRPQSVEDATALIADAPHAMFVAGGTDLYPNMKRRHQEPKTVIGLGGLTALQGVTGEPAGGMRIGALTTLTELAEHQGLRAAYPAVSFTASVISSPLLRNMGTIGGNLLLDTRCNYYNQTYEWRRAINFCMKKDGDICWVAPSSPRCWAVQSSDQAPLLSSLGARVRLVSRAGGERELLVRDLYRNDGIDYLKKRPDELLTEVLLPPVNSFASAYFKVRRRGSFDFPVLSVGATVWFEGSSNGIEGSSNGASADRVVSAARVVVGAVSSGPIEEEAVEAALVGRPLTDEAIREAASRAAGPARPLDNTDYTMSWRKKMVAVYVRRTLEAIREGRPGGTADRLSGVPGLGTSLPMAV